MPRLSLSRILPVLGMLMAPVACLGGTLCGTITDRQTSGPVAGAGIFLRTPAGADTGVYGATDAPGSFIRLDAGGVRLVRPVVRIH